MHEIAPGLWHWTARHRHIRSDVSSYYLRSERVVLDPLLPAQGLGWFEGAEPEHVVLTNRHHDRDAWRLQEVYGCQVHCAETGIHELEGRGSVTPFAFGDELPGGIVAHRVDAICPDETALHIPAHRALAVADGVVRWGEREDLAFVPDGLMGDPAETKQGLRDAYLALLDLDFELLLLAHGAPVTADAKRELRAFVGG